MRKPWGQPDAPEELQDNIFWFEDCSAAAENILLAAYSLGLGAVWTAGYPAMDRVVPIAQEKATSFVPKISLSSHSCRAAGR